MFKIFYAKQDITLYEGAPSGNTGLDEILEIGKRISSTSGTTVKSRSVVQFDIDEVNSAIIKYNIPDNSYEASLQLYTSHAKNLPSSYTIVAKLLAQSWENGTGQLSSLTTNGASWLFVDSANQWISGSETQSISGSTLGIAGGAGGNYLFQTNVSGSELGLISSESFSYRTTDISMNVTDAISVWISGSDGSYIPNYGFLLQFDDVDEQNSAKQGYIRFFSRETHTIYVPKLILYWDDFTFTTGSLQPIDVDSFVVYTQVKPTYKTNEIVKIRIYGRDKFAKKSPLNLFPIETVKYLPATTFFTVVDAVTDEVIIPYNDIYSKVSCDSISNFINIDFSGFMPDRYYRLELKIQNGIQETYITDQIYFKVIR
jgi:hypothetical protein